MESRESIGNSTRLSLDVANLPLTPFGMRHQGSPRKLTSFSVNRFNKLSRRKGRGLLQGKETNEYQCGNKENTDKINSNERRKRWPACESRTSELYSIPENKILPKSSYIPAVEEPVLCTFKDSPTVVNHRPTAGSAITDTGQNTRDASSESSGRRDSVFTDIDDGSFIEFYHGNEKGHYLPCSADNPSRKVPLYYTCESDNDTRYSTSTKTNNALVGFHKYIDKVQVQLKNVLEESEIEDRMQDKVNMNSLHDETVITCSADMRKFFRRKPSPAVVNSTVIDEESLAERGVLPRVFSEISTLTVHPKITVVPNSQHQQQQRFPAKHQIVVSESSENEKSQSSGGKVITNLHPTVGNDNLRITPVNVDDCDIESMPVYGANRGQFSAIPIPPSSDFIATTKAGEDPSVISEDISIISRSSKLRFHIPQKSTMEEVPVTSEMDLICEREDKEKIKEAKSDTAGVKHVLEVHTKVNENEKDPDLSNPVERWVMTSPFKESSFDSSFLQRNEDSFISESPSQPKPKNENFSFKSHALKYKHLTTSDICQLRMNSQSVSKTQDSSVAEIIISDSENSERELIVKRTTMKQRVIVSSSEESEDDKRNGMYVTERRKKKHPIIKESLEKYHIEILESEEESLCLRLSKSQNGTSTDSGKTTQTIGKVAAFPEMKSKDGTKIENHEPYKYKKSTHSYIGNNLEDDFGRSDRLHLGTDINHSASKELLTTPSPKAGNVKNIGDDDPLDLSLVRKELDNLYTTEWRKNENAIFEASPSGKEQEYKIISPRKPFEGPNKRIRESYSRLGLEFEKKNSPLCRTSERSDDEDENTNISEKEKYDNSENKKLDLPNDGDKETPKMTLQPLDSPLEDSFEEYLKKAKVLTQERKQLQEFKYCYENEDQYESSFINDESSDESYSLPQIIKKPKKKNSPIHPRTYTEKNTSVLMSKDRNTDKEKHIPLTKGGQKTAKTTPNVSEDDSFEEYLKKAKVLTKRKNHLQQFQSSDDEDENESSYISDDGSYSLPKIPQKPVRTPENRNSPNEKTDVFKIQGKAIIRTNNDPKATTAWRDSPTIILTSDSDSDEIYSLTERNKVIEPPPSCTTPRTKIKRKVLPKTEGHGRHLPKKYEDCQLSPRLPFLASLSSNVNKIHCHPDALPYIGNFKKKKEELVEKLYKYYNTHVFDNKLPLSMNIKWNARLTKTAGYCYYQINKSAKCGRGSRIELSIKVIDCCERLRDTLIHELCHAAAWIISGYKDGHGPLWKAWAAKAKAVFPELPAISRCHSYEIQCKYTYRCTRCSYSIGRHSKSLDTKKKVCGLCFGKFELLVNSKTQRGQEEPVTGTAASNPPKTPKTPGPFALFVKENYKSVKRSTPNVKHGDVMRILSTKFGEMKTSGNQVFQS